MVGSILAQQMEKYQKIDDYNKMERNHLRRLRDRALNKHERDVLEDPKLLDYIG